MKIGIVIQETFSKKAFLDVTVYLSPTNWKMYAADKINPAGIQIKYDLLIFLKFLLMIIAMAKTAKRPRNAVSIPGE